MHIHNYYADLCLSVRTLLDKYIFSSDLIRSYDFNIANRAFKIDKDYKTQYEFPACIVTLNDDHFIFGERPNVIQEFGPQNVNQQTVLLNAETDNEIFVQEEQVQTNISVIINCESQLQAKDIEFGIKRYLPLSKYIQILEFVSFIEIPYEFLETLDFKNTGHKILNLFTKMNENEGRVEYCYSIKYKPHIRLESINTSIGDASTRSFPVNVEISYLTQMPMWIRARKGEGPIEAINIIYSKFGSDPIADYPVQKVLNVFRDTNLKDSLGTAIPKRVTSTGKWSIKPETGDLIWTDMYSGNSFVAAEKPSDGEWIIRNGKPIWIREEQKMIDDKPVMQEVEYHVDEKKDVLRKDSEIGPIYEHPNRDQVLFDTPKTFIRRTFIVSDQEQLGPPSYMEDKVIFCVVFNKKDFIILKDYRYNFVLTDGTIIHDYPYFSYDEYENKVCFEVSLEEWTHNWKPSLTSPLMIQFLEPKPTKSSCADANLNINV